MRATIFASFAATALLAATSTFAAPAHDQDGRYQQGPANNYGYDRNHKITPRERANWEAQHRNDRSNNGSSQNYGYDRNHRVTPQERANWEAQHRQR